MAERVPVGKRMGALGTFFSTLLYSILWRPLSPVCALGTSPKRGSALRGEGAAPSTPLAPLLGELARSA